MFLFIILAVLLPWSVWRQMQAHHVTTESLIRLPAIFAVVGLLAGVGAIAHGGMAAAALALSVLASIVLGLWRGAVIPLWRDADGSWMSQGNNTTLALWIALIAFKFLLGTVGNVTGWFPTETVGEIFLTLGLSFAVQNLVVARRRGVRAGATASAAI